MWSGDPFGQPAGGDAAQSGSAGGELELGHDPSSARTQAGQDRDGAGEGPGALGSGWSESPADGAAAPGGWGPADPGAAEPWPPPGSEAITTPEPSAPAKPAARSAAAAQKDVTLTDFRLPAAGSDDPDEAHFRETFDKFMALRAETGESASLSYDKFAAKLRQNREQLLSKGTARTVRFTVYKKDGRAAIKASALR